MWLVAIIAINYINNGIEYIDLVQEGSIGIINAINKYKQNKTKYSTLVINEVIDIIEESISKKGKYGHISNRTLHFYMNLDEVINRALLFYGRDTCYDISDLFDYPIYLTRDLINQSTTQPIEFISADETPVEYIVNSEDIATYNLDYEIILKVCNSVLNKNELYIIYHFFGINNSQRMTQQEIASSLKCSPWYISYIITNALIKIRKKIRIDEKMHIINYMVCLL